MKAQLWIDGDGRAQRNIGVQCHPKMRIASWVLSKLNAAWVRNRGGGVVRAELKARRGGGGICCCYLLFLVLGCRRFSSHVIDGLIHALLAFKIGMAELDGMAVEKRQPPKRNEGRACGREVGWQTAGGGICGFLYKYSQ